MSVTPQIAAPLSQSPAGVTAERVHLRPAYSVLYSFKGRPGDGANPYAGLVNVNGTLYGTTYAGGENCPKLGCGTVFAMTTSGTETVLHSFYATETDGSQPEAGLLNVNGTLYGTTEYGGGLSGTGGTLFAITTSGKETVLYSFGFRGSQSGEQPKASLIHIKGTFYGTTHIGGAHENGTVFAITTPGGKAVFYGLKGRFPLAGLINVKGTFYGTTYAGGANNRGTIFKITPSGRQSVLYSFKGRRDGAHPVAGLINVNGTLYGTTAYGGTCTSTGEPRGCGTVFAVTPSGTESVLYRFANEPDGSHPNAGLLNVNGTLFGTTANGGSNGGEGTVFSITPSGSETVLHSFAGGSGDGANPIAGLINVKGTLYGTTSSGGANDYGTVFSLSP
jgi:uncharacterized repeat protein (TIGR03803 family)